MTSEIEILEKNLEILTIDSLFKYFFWEKDDTHTWFRTFNGKKDEYSKNLRYDEHARWIIPLNYYELMKVVTKWFEVIEYEEKYIFPFSLAKDEVEEVKMNSLFVPTNFSFRVNRDTIVNRLESCFNVKLEWHPGQTTADPYRVLLGNYG